MRILNAGDKCTQLDLNSKLIGDLFLIINVFSFSLKEQTSFRTEITVPQIHIYIWGIERSGFFNDRGKWVKGFENQRV